MNRKQALANSNLIRTFESFSKLIVYGWKWIYLGTKIQYAHAGRHARTENTVEQNVEKSK